ncbi:response regulator [Algoriphagus aestuariicola]|jgi:CheY-like chemotaxis protein|uniref:Response regulator n=1 Tax=Algoriphagus aestuariicola TaxID=1852016 RepID=A0ABS3BPU7_9BACT|nr:response regulator [Algoriphagus aestuariicola]MBN7801310.1 response regulator [Algoriphagus aestuariicola]
MKSKKVLIVDDNDLNRKLFENLIGQLFSYESAKNGLEALELAKSADFNLILMDIQMPMMDGITAMKKIRQETHLSCPILAVTAYADESDRSSFLEEGFDDFITKPIRPREFLHLVQFYLKTNPNNESSDSIQKGELEILDRKILEQLLKYNSKQAIWKIFDDFLAECEETERLIAAYAPESPISGLLEKVHTVKGNSGTLGAMGIFQASVKAEELGRLGKTCEFYLQLKNLKNEIRQFRDFLSQEPIFGT